MNARRIVLKLGFIAAFAIVILSMGGPASEAAAVAILVDDGSTADDCGKYDGKPANPLLLNALNTAPSGATVLICPGTYTITGNLIINGKPKLTVKRALTGPGSRPLLDIDNMAPWGLGINNSGATIDGLVFDGRGNDASYTGIFMETSSATIKNVTVIGPNEINTAGIIVDNAGIPKSLNVSISNSNIVGYSQYGIFVQGRTKLSVTGSFLDGSDGGRITSIPSYHSGVFFNGGPTLGETPSGTISKSRIVNNANGVTIGEVSKVTVSGNVFVDNLQSIYVAAGDLVNNADNNKITGNTIMGVPSDGTGILIEDINVPNSTIRNTTISKNIISAAQYEMGGLPPTAIKVSANAATTTAVTVTISGNTLFGFATNLRIVNVGGNAMITDKGNDATP